MPSPRQHPRSRVHVAWLLHQMPQITTFLSKYLSVSSLNCSATTLYIRFPAEGNWNIGRCYLSIRLFCVGLDTPTWRVFQSRVVSTTSAWRVHLLARWFCVASWLEWIYTASSSSQRPPMQKHEKGSLEDVSRNGIAQSTRLGVITRCQTSGFPPSPLPRLIPFSLHSFHFSSHKLLTSF